MRTLVPTLALASCSLTLVAEDQQPLPATPEAQTTLVVTARREATSTERLPAAISVVTQDDLTERGGAESLAEALQGTPGLTAYSDGGLGSRTTLRLRGAFGYSIAVLRDGVPVRDPVSTQSQPEAGVMPMTGLERVEVLRGAHSGLYGSGALGGVINQLSVEPTATHQGLSGLSFGTYQTLQARAQASGPINPDWGYAVAVGSVHSDGISAYAGLTGSAEDFEADPYSGTDADARITRALGDAGTVGFQVTWMDAKSDYDAGDPDDAESSIERGSLRLRSYTSLHLADWELEAQVAWTDYQRTIHNTYGGDFDGDNLYLSAMAHRQLAAGVQLKFGLDHLAEQGEQTDPDGSAVFSDKASLTGMWSQVVWTHQHTEVEATLRHDLHSEEGGATTGRLALSQQLGSGLSTLWIAGGTSFRAPALYEQFGGYNFSGTFYQLGDPDLEAETGYGYELGHRTHLGDEAQLEQTVFVTRYDQRIIYDTTTFAYANSDTKEEVRGLETALSWDLSPRVQLQLTHTWQEAKDEDSEIALRLPKHQLQLSEQVDVNSHLWVRATLRHMSGRKDQFFDPMTFTSSDVTLDAVTLFGAAAGWDINQTWTTTLRLDNIFDTQYQSVAGYGAPGFTTTLGVQARW